jgi:hypothetical protein
MLQTLAVRVVALTVLAASLAVFGSADGAKATTGPCQTLAIPPHGSHARPG